jgi:excisionase family DNA binding protein
MTDRLLTTRELAELLGIRPETVLRWTASGRLPGYRISSNALRFRVTEIEGWLASRKIAAGSCVASDGSEAYAAEHA